MNSWIWSAQTALLVGGIAFAVVFLPLIAVHYRRYGTGNVPRLLVAGAFSVYAAALVTYTLFPLPSGAQWCAATPPISAHTTPFHFLADIARETAGLSLSEVLVHRSVLQVVFNVVLFVPWGIFARRWWGLSRTATIASGFAVSLAIEATQYTALWGLYPCRYRVPDVDDLILNTLGAAIGMVLAPIVLGWLPRSRDLAATRGEPRPVTARRRWLGMLIDVVCSTLVLVATTALLRIVQALLGADASSAILPWADAAAVLAVWLLVFAGPAWAGSGASLGQAAVLLTPVWADERGRWGWGTRTQRVLRASILPGALFLGTVAAGAILPVAALAVAVLPVPFTRGRRGLSCALTGAEMADVRTIVRSGRVDPRAVEREFVLVPGRSR